MPGGIDKRLVAERQVGPGSSLHQRIQAMTASQDYMFGGRVGTEDDGKFTQNRPTPGSYARGEHYSGLGALKPGQEGPAISRPVFHGAEPNAIKLAQMHQNYDSAMAGLMQHPSDGSRQTEGLVDRGMGRLSDGVERPVHSYIDERIKNKPGE